MSYRSAAEEPASQNDPWDSSWSSSQRCTGQGLIDRAQIANMGRFRALMASHRCRRMNDINYKALINQNYNREGSYTSMHINGIYYCAASDYLLADEIKLTQDDTKETKHYHTVNIYSYACFSADLSDLCSSAESLRCEVTAAFHI